jgi:NADH-quinone oxidoreductase subunit L
MHTLPSSNLVWLIPGLPLFGFLLFAFAGKRMGRKAVGFLATLFVFASFAFSVIVLLDLLKMPGEEKRAFASLIPGGADLPWIAIGDFQVYYRALLDPLSLLMCLIVTGVGGLIHLYATGYMAEDRDYSRFFTYFNLFIFSMLMLVLAESILLMFVGWEGVGLCSYLLIAFWYEDVNNSKAGNKAFIVNRIGDVGFALGVMMIFATFGTLSFYTPGRNGFLDQAVRGITNGGPLLTETATAIGLLLFIGAVGKSAQFPLYVWLPDAMAGPTPVSALIHAATMVTAGVVMVTRVSPLLVHSHVVMTTIACVGVFTAFFAATIALTQNDIKRVLAYSTVSQLGYMFLGCGVGAFTAGMFHVTTHAFFKALLFLGAGSVIHALSGEQDMRKMGGLKGRIRTTYLTMAVGWLAIAGFPGLSGFWSKDEILGKASGYGSIGPILYAVGLFTALLTAFYMTRLMWKTFYSDPRFEEAEPAAHGHGGHDRQDADTTDAGHAHSGVHESPPSMTVPLIILAFLSAFGGLIGTPWTNRFETYLEPAVGRVPIHEAVPPSAGLVLGTLVAAIGIGLGCVLYSRKKATGELLTPEQKAKSRLYQGSAHLWYIDGAFYRFFVVGGGDVANFFWKGIDRFVIDGSVNGIGALVGFFSEVFRRAQTGYVRNYALLMLFGVLLVVGSLLWPLFSK